jgi:hypothetical protein
MAIQKEDNSKDEDNWQPLEGYNLDEVDADNMAGDLIVQFPESDNAHVVETHDDGSPEGCSCKDYEYRREKKGQDCKHMAAAREKSEMSETEEVTDDESANDEVKRTEDEVPETSGGFEQIELVIDDPAMATELKGVLQNRLKDLEQERASIEDKIESIEEKLEKL